VAATLHQGDLVAAVVSSYDSVLFDLDGVVYLGKESIPFAVESINRVQEMGLKVGYVTNNSSRKADSISDQLVGFGLDANSAQVVGSARAGAKMLAERIPAGSKVLVIGGEGLAFEVRALGFELVESSKDAPIAVIQGFSPDLGWKDLAEASYAIQNGAIWLATNQDWTIPREAGIAPGNGTLVSAVHTAVGILPDFAGKPFRPIYDQALQQLDIKRPLFVGDRLDTDIRGANNFGIDSACVMTGIASRKELLSAKPEDRPTFIFSDLRDLFCEYPTVKKTKHGLSCNKVEVEVAGTQVMVTKGDPGSMDALRAATQLIWSQEQPIYALEIDSRLH
jgi:glycerol-1-phosphatase